MSVPKAPINRKYTYLQRFSILANHESLQELLVRGHSKHILGSFGDFGMTFRSLWAYEGGLGSILVDFLKIFIFPIDFNDFI